MRENLNWRIILGAALLLASIAAYLVHYAIFRDPHHIFIFMVGDIAFVFVEVLLVTLIIHRLLTEKEKRQRLEKLNMVIGAFFSEVGTRLLVYLSDFDPKLDSIRDDLIVKDNWSQEEFAHVDKKLREYDYQINGKDIQLENLGKFLVGKRDFLLGLMENPTVLEHELFTDLLQAVFHLTEELAARGDLCSLPDSDCEHLVGDIRRVYSRMVHQWLDYMQHLKVNYPYFFNFAMRTNPFDQTASPYVE
ncbi:MAG: hypothetical protein R6U89_03880 [Dehalococcoidia bacterium]